MPHECEHKALHQFHQSSYRFPVRRSPYQACVDAQLICGCQQCVFPGDCRIDRLVGFTEQEFRGTSVSDAPAIYIHARIHTAICLGAPRLVQCLVVGDLCFLKHLSSIMSWGLSRLNNTCMTGLLWSALDLRSEDTMLQYAFLKVSVGVPRRSMCLQERVGAATWQRR